MKIEEILSKSKIEELKTMEKMLNSKGYTLKIVETSQEKGKPIDALEIEVVPLSSNKTAYNN